MIKNLLRPKWRHPDPEIRAKALAQGGVETEIAIDKLVPHKILLRIDGGRLSDHSPAHPVDEAFVARTPRGHPYGQPR